MAVCLRRPTGDIVLARSAKLEAVMRPARLLALCLFAALLTPPLPAQAPAPKDERGEWLQRALGYTAAIRDDEFRLPYREQLILPGRLAALWWKADPVRAKAWLETAVSRVEFLLTRNLMTTAEPAWAPYAFCSPSPRRSTAASPTACSR
jgi:hypothetical protein